MSSESLFKASKDFPYHVSIGAILFDKNNNIICEEYEGDIVYKLTGVEGKALILMKETLENFENVENCLSRGLKEELNITESSIIGYLGGVEYEAGSRDKKFKKTVLYFLVKLEQDNIELVGNKGGVTFSIKRENIDDLIQTMKNQRDLFNREDLDESKILERAKVYLN